MRRWLKAVRRRVGEGGRVGPVNHVALGTFCHGAAALRAIGLRRWTGPLDWVFSTPAMAAACLGDDGATLLDPRHLRSVPTAELSAGATRQCRHLLFEERFGLPTLFNHHDPAASPADRDALRRAAGRLREALDGDADNVFYVVSERAWPEDEIAAVRAALDARPARSRLAVVTILPEAGAADWTDDGEADGIRRATVRVRSRSRGVRFGDPADDAVLGEALADLARSLAPGGAGASPTAEPTRRAAGS